MNPSSRFISYPPIEKHGVIGDRRTAALIAADGTMGWLCVPAYDSPPIFGALLDADRGGLFRLGPASPTIGCQDYQHNTAVLLTVWATDQWVLELTDAMAWPETDRPRSREDQMILVRRLRCVRGHAACRLDIEPRRDFIQKPTISATASGVIFRLDELTLKLWTTSELQEDGGSAHAAVNLKEGEQLWAILTVGKAEEPWTGPTVERLLDNTVVYWRHWLDGLTYTGPRGDRVRRSALTIHLLSYAPTGSMVAAPTTSVPERLGGDCNYDYRYAWVRDASLSLAVLALLGDTKAAKSYMDWLAGLDSSTDSPLQVVYGINGKTDLTERARDDVAGYQGSRPVRFGNHAFQQRQLGSLGYFVDCAFIYLQQGGAWRDEYWNLTQRIADYTAKNWTWPDSGIWERTAERHYVSSRIMSWVVFDRAIKISAQLGHRETIDHWRTTMDTIHTQVMREGWSDPLGAFRQSYESEALDASALLIPVMGFLPADHPRMVSTVQRIEESLMIDGFVYRFHEEWAAQTSGTLGEREGAFLPCTFWLATTYAMAGRPDRAEAILNRAETCAGSLGLFAEELDPRSGRFLGNSPLLFAHVEYIRAVMEVAKARPLDHARLMVGKLKQWLGRRLLGQDRRLRKEA